MTDGGGGILFSLRSGHLHHPLTPSRMTSALAPNDPRLPAVRARCFLLVRSLWKAGVLRQPLALEPSEAPALRVLAPLWRRLRVELLGAALVETILPPIERQLASAGVLRREEASLPPRRCGAGAAAGAERRGSGTAEGAALARGAGAAPPAVAALGRAR